MARDRDDILNEPYPRLPLTPPEGWSLDNFPTNDVPTRTELIRGVLVDNPLPYWHSKAVEMLRRLIDEQCPPEYLAERSTAIRKSSRAAPEPDISIVHANAFDLDLDRTFYMPEHVVSTAEVLTPESEERDREDKPAIYAAMGIPTFWLVERAEDGSLIVHERRLIDGGVYRLIKTHAGRLTTDVPFPIDIPLTVRTR